MVSLYRKEKNMTTSADFSFFNNFYLKKKYVVCKENFPVIINKNKEVRRALVSNGKYNYLGYSYFDGYVELPKDNEVVVLCVKEDYLGEYLYEYFSSSEIERVKETDQIGVFPSTYHGTLLWGYSPESELKKILKFYNIKNAYELYLMATQTRENMSTKNFVEMFKSKGDIRDAIRVASQKYNNARLPIMTNEIDGISFCHHAKDGECEFVYNDNYNQLYKVINTDWLVPVHTGQLVNCKLI